MDLRAIFEGPLRAAAWTIIAFGLIVLVLDPPSLAGFEDLVKGVAAAALLIIACAWMVVWLIGEEAPEPEFRRIMDRSERMAVMAPEQAPTDFDELVIDAIDGLPSEFQRILEEVPVIVSNRGHEHRAYGHYIGDTIARDNHPDHIVIYEDTLVRDFGRYPGLLRAQVEQTLRHELAHHLGWDEPGVRNLGL